MDLRCPSWPVPRVWGAKGWLATVPNNFGFGTVFTDKKGHEWTSGRGCVLWFALFFFDAFPPFPLTLRSCRCGRLRFNVTRNRKLLHRHPEVSREVVEETLLLILQESQCDPLLDLVSAVSRWMFSGVLIRPFVVGKVKFFSFRKHHLSHIESFRVDFRCVHRFQLLNVCKPMCHPSKFTRVQSISEEQSK